MSKIQKQLCEVTEVSAKRGEDRQDFLARVIRGVSELSDKDWEALPVEAQNWFNDAADKMNKKKEIPDFPDAEPEAPAPVARRGAAKADEAKAAEPTVGAKVKVVTKRGKTIEGEVVELTDEMIVVKDDKGEETEIAKDRIDTCEVQAAEDKPRRRRAADDEPTETPDDPKAGDEVEVLTKRGKTIKGKVVEVDGDTYVIDDGEGEIEVDADKIDKITVTKAGKAAAKKDEKKDDGKGKDEKKDDGKGKRASAKSNGGVSATGRMRELICEDPDMSKEDVGAKLKKEGLEFRDNTLDLVYADTQKVIGILKGLKKLK